MSFIDKATTVGNAVVNPELSAALSLLKISKDLERLTQLMEWFVADQDRKNRSNDVKRLEKGPDA